MHIGNKPGWYNLFMPIQLLPDEVASQIAAGEVVERPASVVKELVENALDAGAAQISVKVEQAGRRLIEVADDGCGISPDQLGLAVMRHATSKLRKAEDLFHISTLGFRGEALASIGSVARLTLTSCAAGQTLGARLLVDGGRVEAVVETGAPVGTVVRVEDLFFNVPARLKFIKSDTTERQQIEALVTRYALAYPQTRFALEVDSRTVLRTSGNGNRREVLANLYNVDIARQMLAVSLDEPGLVIDGFISPIAVTRSNRREIIFFVNGRPVQDAALISALLNAYRTLLMVGRYPLAVLFVTLDPEDVDVNVHPAKAEVRFRSPDRVFSAVQRAVRRGLLAYSPVPAVQPAGWGGANVRPANETLPMLWSTPESSGGPMWPESETRTAQPEPVGIPEGDNPPPVSAPTFAAAHLPLMRLIGQVGGTYLVAEGPDGLYLIDQHAAHERVLFERYLHQLGGAVPAQALLEPVILQLPPYTASLLEEQLPGLSRLGFDVELFGPGTFRIRAIPAFLSGADPQAAVRVIVEDFEEDETPLQAEREARLAARICKRVAVKGGQSLSIEEQRSLLQELENCQSPRTCPHGRPTMIHLSVDLLERQFGRRGAR